MSYTNSLRTIVYLAAILLLYVQSAVCFIASPTEKRIVSSGRRCLVVPSTREELYPVLVLLGGIAQTISSWEHLLSLSQNRKVIVYECVGQRIGTASDMTTKYINASLPSQAEKFLGTLDKNVTPEESVDIAGFSFGG
jgi:hypothetical protein